jgi:hypothetical protein
MKTPDNILLKEIAYLSAQQRSSQNVLRALTCLNQQFIIAVRNNSFISKRNDLLTELNGIYRTIEEQRKTARDKPQLKTQDAESNIGNASSATNKSDVHSSPEIADDKLVERVENAYKFLEYIAIYKAKSFSNQERARLRRAQSAIQRLRLRLIDLNISQA